MRLGFLKKDSHYSICLILTLCLLSNFGENKGGTLYSKSKVCFSSILYMHWLFKQINYSLCFLFSKYSPPTSDHVQFLIKELSKKCH